MQLDKDIVLNLIRDHVGGDQADKAEDELPDQIDTERDAGLLQKFGVGELGGLGDKLGL